MNIALKAGFVLARKTQREVAFKLGIPETRLSEFVQGIREPTDDQKLAIAGELNRKVGDIF